MGALSIKQGRDLFPELTAIEKHIACIEAVQEKKITALKYQQLLKIYYDKQAIDRNSSKRKSPPNSLWTKFCNALRF